MESHLCRFLSEVTGIYIEQHKKFNSRYGRLFTQACQHSSNLYVLVNPNNMLDEIFGIGKSTTAKCPSPPRGPFFCREQLPNPPQTLQTESMAPGSPRASSRRSAELAGSHVSCIDASVAAAQLKDYLALGGAWRLREFSGALANYYAWIEGFQGSCASLVVQCKCFSEGCRFRPSLVLVACD